MKKSNEISDVVLEFACHEYIDEHNYCNRCARTLIDFTCLKNEDLANAINNSDGKICGRFRTTQLSHQFVKYAAVGVMATTLTIAASAQEDKELLVSDSSLKECSELNGKIVTYVTSGITISPSPKLKMNYKKLMNTIESQLLYPKELKTKYSTYIQADIDTLGNITDARIDSWDGKQDVNETADAEALRVVKNLKDVFFPAIIGEHVIRSTYSFQIEFNPDKRKQNNK